MRGKIQIVYNRSGVSPEHNEVRSYKGIFSFLWHLYKTLVSGGNKYYIFPDQNKVI